MMTADRPTGLALLRAPFPANQISKLPKPTKKQTDEVKADFKNGIRCQICGTWHHRDVVHLDYVGHAALTDRLLDCDPAWNWEPMALTPEGLPIAAGGMWIKLSVCGVTRLGYGDADGKTGGNAVKEMIGDALRNAAMRFGAALDLWHKGDLHADDEPAPMVEPRRDEPMPETKSPSPSAISQAVEYLQGADDLPDLQRIWRNIPRPVASLAMIIAAKDDRKRELQLAATAAQFTQPADLGGDVIPY
jgi:hypothetical protein